MPRATWRRPWAGRTGEEALFWLCLYGPGAAPASRLHRRPSSILPGISRHVINSSLSEPGRRSLCRHEAMLLSAQALMALLSRTMPLSSRAVC